MCVNLSSQDGSVQLMGDRQVAMEESKCYKSFAGCGPKKPGKILPNTPLCWP